MKEDPITLLIAYEQGKKCAEVDISQMAEIEVARIILCQDKMGRKWGYDFTSKQEMRERRESHE